MKSTARLRCATVIAPVLFHPVLLTEGLHPAIPKAVNLTIFIVVMYLLVRKKASAFFAERLAAVRATLERAAKEKAEADAKMLELNARLSKLDTELAGITQQTSIEAQAERERTEAETKLDAEKLRVIAGREIEGAKQSALLHLREYTADKAVELAEQMIREELTPQDDAKLLQRVGEELTKVA